MGILWPVLLGRTGRLDGTGWRRGEERGRRGLAPIRTPPEPLVPRQVLETLGADELICRQSAHGAEGMAARSVDEGELAIGCSQPGLPPHSLPLFFARLVLWKKMKNSERCKAGGARLSPGASRSGLTARPLRTSERDHVVVCVRT